MNYVRNRYFAAAISGLALVAAGCSTPGEPAAEESTAADNGAVASNVGEPAPGNDNENERVVRISADATSTEQVLWAYIYREVLAQQGREAEVFALEGADTAQRWDMLQTRKIDFMITCTGEFVTEFNPALAEDLLHNEDGQDPNEIDLHDQFHREVMGLLPPTIVTTAPSSAQGCGDSSQEIPQDFTPLFGAGLFNREETGEIQKVTRLLDDRNLEELQDKLSDGLSAEEAAGQWAAVNVTGSSPDSVSDEA